MHRLLALIAAGALLLAGCGTATSVNSVAENSADSGNQTGVEANGAGGGKYDPTAWEFSAEALDGSTFDARTIASAPTVVWFWAPWCPTCRAQIPTVTSLAEEYDGQVEFIGAGGLAADEQIRDLADQIPHLTHLIDVEGAVWNKFEVKAQSTYAAIDAEGRIVANGYLDNDELEQLVAELAS